jgi:hypothetical protein
VDSTSRKLGTRRCGSPLGRNVRTCTVFEIRLSPCLLSVTNNVTDIDRRTDGRTLADVDAVNPILVDRFIQPTTLCRRRVETAKHRTILPYRPLLLLALRGVTKEAEDCRLASTKTGTTAAGRSGLSRRCLRWRLRPHPPYPMQQHRHHHQQQRNQG